MKMTDFVAEFESADFPKQTGRWISFDDHDPPFSPSTLKQMESRGVLELDAPNRRYRLTMKATAVLESK